MGHHVFQGQHPESHRHTGLLAELYWACRSAEECQPRGTEFPLEFLKLGFPKAVAIAAPGSPQEAGSPSMDLFPSSRQEGGGREMRSGLNTRGRGPGSGAWTPTAGSREPRPWREGSGRGGGAGNPGASHGIGPDRRSSQGCLLATAGSGRCSRGQPRGRARQAVLTGVSARHCWVWPMLQRPVQRRHGHAPTRDKGPDQLVPHGWQSTKENVLWGARGPGKRAAWPRRPGPGCAHSRWGVGTRNQAPVTGTGRLRRDIPGQRALCQAGPHP